MKSTGSCSAAVSLKAQILISTGHVDFSPWLCLKYFVELFIPFNLWQIYAIGQTINTHYSNMKSEREQSIKFSKKA